MNYRFDFFEHAKHYPMGETENDENICVQVTEGAAIVKIEKEKVFLNPVQVMNRDLSIIVINNFFTWRKKHLGSSKPLLILEPLAASGLRSIRYAKEIASENLLGIISGDLSEDAADSIRRQRQLNEVSPNVLSSICAEATALMNCFASLSPESQIATFIPELPASTSDEAKKDAEKITSYLKEGRRPDVIDIDPYGSVAPFLDGAVRAVANGGLLCITSTDASVLCGNNPEVSFYKYGGTALKSQGYIHEMSLRLIIQMVRAAGAKYKRFVYPLCAFSLDFYVRMFVLVIDSANACKHILSSTSYVHQCVQCDNYVTGDLGFVTTKKVKTKRKRSKSEQDEQNVTKKSKTENGNSVPHEVQDSNKEEIHPEEKNDFFNLSGKDLIEFYKNDTTCCFKPGRQQGKNTCEECGAEMWIGGPFYNGPLHDKTFMKETLESLDVEDNEITRKQKFRNRVKSLLTAASEDLPRPALFLSLPNLCCLIL
eukprot:GHVP01042603.1.p1 GENE.GHVP01042603.1~~GHVP01042603.1.p1  ORF type:complete len:484 (+),score=89.42 GHVP01042603.1:403-1854(+)